MTHTSMSNVRYDDGYYKQPVTVHANEHVAIPELFHRKQDITNSIVDGYEYAQPKSFRLVAPASFQVNNPFNSPCEVAILYASVNDAGALLALTFDNNDSSTLSTTTSITDFPGLLISQTGVAPLAPALQWIDFQSFVQVRALAITTFTEFCLVFRRKTDQMIPVNKIPFNELTQ